MSVGNHTSEDHGMWRAAAARYSLLPLRVFLGVTFVYAGLDKLTDPAYLAASGTGSFTGALAAVGNTAAVPALVELAQQAPRDFALAVAVGEVAVGVGTLVGLLTRIAALGGALISLTLWLTVTWQIQPYYLGNDLAYLMAWLPLILAGAPLLSLDAAIAARRRRRRDEHRVPGYGGYGNGRRGGYVGGYREEYAASADGAGRRDPYGRG